MPTIRQQPIRQELYSLRQRNTARRTSPLPPNYVTIKETINNAIINRHNQPTQPFTRVMEEDTKDIVNYAKSNINLYHQENITRQYEAYYQIGYALQIVQDNQEGTPSWTEAIHYLDLSRHEAYLAERTYDLFKHWPGAI